MPGADASTLNGLEVAVAAPAVPTRVTALPAEFMLRFENVARPLALVVAVSVPLSVAEPGLLPMVMVTTAFAIGALEGSSTFTCGAGVRTAFIEVSPGWTVNDMLDPAPGLI